MHVLWLWWKLVARLVSHSTSFLPGYNTTMAFNQHCPSMRATCCLSGLRLHTRLMRTTSSESSGRISTGVWLHMNVPVLKCARVNPKNPHVTRASHRHVNSVHQSRQVARGDFL